MGRGTNSKKVRHAQRSMARGQVRGTHIVPKGHRTTRKIVLERSKKNKEAARGNEQEKIICSITGEERIHSEKFVSHYHKHIGQIDFSTITRVAE
tara:strand:- start:279 stop:563 length:285 start_codon:yes stop_codon:yes gene_type:complete